MPAGPTSLCDICLKVGSPKKIIPGVPGRAFPKRVPSKTQGADAKFPCPVPQFKPQDWMTLLFWSLNVVATLTVGFTKRGETIMSPTPGRQADGKFLTSEAPEMVYPSCFSSGCEDVLSFHLVRSGFFLSMPRGEGIARSADTWGRLLLGI